MGLQFAIFNSQLPIPQLPMLNYQCSITNSQLPILNYQGGGEPVWDSKRGGGPRDQHIQVSRKQLCLFGQNSFCCGQFDSFGDF